MVEFNVRVVLTPNVTDARDAFAVCVDVPIAAVAAFDISGIAVVAFDAAPDVVTKLRVTLCRTSQ